MGCDPDNLNINKSDPEGGTVHGIENLLVAVEINVDQDFESFRPSTHRYCTVSRVWCFKTQLGGSGGNRVTNDNPSAGHGYTTSML